MEAQEYCINWERINYPMPNGFLILFWLEGINTKIQKVFHITLPLGKRVDWSFSRWFLQSKPYLRMGRVITYHGWCISWVPYLRLGWPTLSHDGSCHEYPIWELASRHFYYMMHFFQHWRVYVGEDGLEFEHTSLTFIVYFGRYLVYHVTFR